MTDLILKSLFVWRVTHMLVHERGLFAIFEKLRTKSGIYVHTEFKHIDDKTRIVKSEEKKATTELGELLLCFYCTSIWIGLVIARFNLINTIAYSAMAIVIEELINGNIFSKRT